MSESRKHFRKNLRLTGYVERDGVDLEFQLQDLSLGGMKAHFEEDPELVLNREVPIRLPGLKLHGYVVPVWGTAAHQGGFEAGFDFASLDGVEGNVYRFEKSGG